MLGTLAAGLVRLDAGTRRIGALLLLRLTVRLADGGLFFDSWRYRQVSEQRDQLGVPSLGGQVDGAAPGIGRGAQIHALRVAQQAHGGGVAVLRRGHERGVAVHAGVDAVAVAVAEQLAQQR